MNKVNFNCLSAYKTPEKWIEKAAAIPDTAVENRTVFPLYRYITAASIVLVSAVGLLIFLHFGSGNAPVMVHEGGIAATDSKGDETVAGETTGSAPQTEASTPAETIAVLSADAQGSTAVTYREKPVPTASGTRARSTESKNSPTTPASSTAPTSAGATEKASPTAPSAERPPAETEASAPTAAPATEPPLTDCRFTVTVKYPPPAGEVPAAEVETDEPIVFCRMYDADGNLVGSSNLFAEEKRATVVSFDPDDALVVTYDPLEKGLPIIKGRYTYVFYDYYTGTELCRDTVEY